MTNHSGQIEKIYQDLISADSSFAQDENQVKVLIAQLLEAKQEVRIDAQFARLLRQNLAVQINSEIKVNSSENNFMKRFKYFVTAGAAVAVIAIVAVSSMQNKVLLPGNQEIARAAEGAFGKLDTQALAGARGQGGGGGGGSETAAPLAVDSKAVPGMGSGGDAILPYYPVNYKFVYRGEEFIVDADKMDVFQRIKGFGSSVNLNSFLDRFAVELFNVNKFSSSKLDYFRASEDKDFGYALNIDMREGNISIGENWERWMTADRMCTDQACFEQNRIKVEQVPADEIVIAAANQFLDEFGINKENYGSPIVQNFWRADYERLADKSAYYVPEYVSVIYPAVVAGNEIYDESGNKTGLYVNYNIRVGKVSSVSELTGQRFESSSYTVEQDAAKIIQVAEKGGFRSWYPTGEPNAKIETVELGTPITGYVRLWHNLNGQTRDMFVPALIFPVTKKADQFYASNVVVPLVKDILDSSQKPPEIFPMGDMRSSN